MKKQYFDNLQLELASLVRYIAALTPSETAGKVDRSGFLILHYIDSVGPAGTKELAAYFKLDVSTMSRQTRSLEEKGSLIRTPNPLDKRAVTFDLSDQGKLHLAQYRKTKIKRLEELFGNWASEDLADFSRLLEKANDSIRNSKL